MSPTADPKMVAWGRNTKFLEEHFAHVGIEVLSGMNDPLGQKPVTGLSSDFTGYDGSLDELGPSTNDSY